MIESEPTGLRSTALFDGLRAVNADYFAILDDDDIVYPNHYASLISTMRRSGKSVAYSGSMRLTERGPPELPIIEEAIVAHFRDYDLGALYRLDNFVTSNSFAARSSLLDNIPLADPRLACVEDIYLLLLLSRETDFAFTWDVSCAFYWRKRSGDNIMNSRIELWAESAERMKYLVGAERRNPSGWRAPGNDAAGSFEADVFIDRGKSIKHLLEQRPIIGKVIDLLYRGSSSLARRLAPKPE